MNFAQILTWNQLLLQITHCAILIAELAIVPHHLEKIVWHLVWDKVRSTMENLDSHDRFKLLLEGCSELGLPVHTAEEFVKYSQVNSKYETPISPSTKVDELQHWVLLNTHIRPEVEKLLGGPINHRTSTASLDDFSKAERRWALFMLFYKVYVCWSLVYLDSSRYWSNIKHDLKDVNLVLILQLGMCDCISVVHAVDTPDQSTSLNTGWCRVALCKYNHKSQGACSRHVRFWSALMSQKSTFCRHG